MSLSKQQSNFALAIGHFLVWINTKTKYEVTLGEAYRTQEQHEWNVASGKTDPDLKRSKHQDRLAIDLNLFKDGNYITNKNEYISLGVKWEQIGGIWGGRFGVDKEDYDKKVGWDANHFEWRL